MGYFGDIFHALVDQPPEWMLGLTAAWIIYAGLHRREVIQNFVTIILVGIYKIVTNKPIFIGGKTIMQKFWWKGKNGGISTRKISFHRVKSCQDLARSASPVKEIRREIAELRGFRPCGRCCK